jgi:DNA-binding NtrC family response regulator/tetratricopeptide (TPR) repeat protein
MQMGPSQIDSAVQLIRSGRFQEAVAVLQEISQKCRASHRQDLTHALLADALQRIGQNDDAEAIASRNLEHVSHAPELCARYHFVLGNVHRERGAITEAIAHLQKANSAAGANLELSSWIQLRLTAAVAELSGAQTAMGRLDEVRRTLTRFGDPGPFAALHLWLVEAESTRGNLESARHHLKIAHSLLSQVDNVWLHGYLAINSAAVHYHSAEILDARHWAHIAIDYAQKSGHRTTRRAAYANLGYLEFSMARFDRAEECFEVALECCEKGSVNELAVLDNVAQIKLQRGDLAGCKSLLSRIEQLPDPGGDIRRRHVTAWAVQTKVRLLLKLGLASEAQELSKSIDFLAKELPRGRMTIESYLVRVEALLSTNEGNAAAEALSPLLLSPIQLPPDLFAEMERVTGRTLAATGAYALARTRLERSADAYATIGHSLGEEQAQGNLEGLPVGRAAAGFETGLQLVLDRIRALLDTRNRPDLFGREAMLLLEDLHCTQGISLVAEEGNDRRLIKKAGNISSAPAGAIAITLIANSGRKLTLSYLPGDDSISKLTAMCFERVIREILVLKFAKSEFDDQEIVWTTNEGGYATQGIVFACDAMRSILRVAKQIAPTDVSVLLTGETGTGKEVIARTLHEWSLRSTMPFLAINCAAVPRELLESQLFGHRKGAFSGANDHFPGLVRAANGGTLLLDEIGEMPFDMQAKLLRFLELGEVHPIGETQSIKVNVRLIFATNGNLEEAVSQNRFRQDLFYRINVVPMRIPPLRERREEIPVLAKLFAQRSAKEFAKQPLEFSASAMELLILHSWPGNVRQLANEIRRLSALLESATCIMPEHLSAQLRPKPHNGTSPIPAVPELAVRIDQPLDKAVARLESEMIQRALRESNGHL